MIKYFQTENLIYRSLILAKKELYQYLHTPATYGAAVFFLAFSSVWLFHLQRYFAADQATLRPYFSAFPVVFILVIPVITMKSWAEERKTGTIEILLTMPFTEWDLVLGKYFSAFAVMLIMLVLTLPVPITLCAFGTFDPGVIFCEYFGAVLLTSSAAALGLLFSSFAKNQAGSFLGSAVILLIITFINQVTVFLNFPQWLSDFISFFFVSPSL